MDAAARAFFRDFWRPYCPCCGAQDRGIHDALACSHWVCHRCITPTTLCHYCAVCHGGISRRSATGVHGPPCADLFAAMKRLHADTAVRPLRAILREDPERVFAMFDAIRQLRAQTTPARATTDHPDTTSRDRRVLGRREERERRSRSRGSNASSSRSRVSTSSPSPKRPRR